MKDKKWWIFIVIVILIIIALLIFKNTRKKEQKEENTSQNNVTIITSDNFNGNEFIEVQEDGTRLNKSEKFSTTKIVEGLEISNIRLTEKDNVTQIFADVKNTTDKSVEGFFVTITFLNKDGETIVILGGYIPSVEANGTATLNTNSTGDFANAYDFTVARMEEE